MELKKEDFERLVSLAYQRGRVEPVRFIEQRDIDNCIADTYKLLNLVQQYTSGKSINEFIEIKDLSNTIYFKDEWDD